MLKALVFDVESVGLHGEGFAVGAVVVDLETGHEDASLLAWCDPIRALACRSGEQKARQWVDANVMPHLKGQPTCESAVEVRKRFWDFFRDWEAVQGTTVWADCGWPVESRFLVRCVDDSPGDRTWRGPYPLLEIAVAIQLAGGDPLATRDRLPIEQPEHHPLADARQSARLLREALKIHQADSSAADLYRSG